MIFSETDVFVEVKFDCEIGCAFHLGVFFFMFFALMSRSDNWCLVVISKCTFVF